MTVTDAVAGVVASLQPMDERQKALASIAANLAQVLDSGRAPMATAAISRELRETLTELTKGEDVHDDFAQFLSGISSPVPASVRHTQD